MNVLSITEDRIDKLKWEIIIKDVNRYKELMNDTDELKNSNTSFLGNDLYYCSLFCSFYNVHRDNRWKREFFNLLQKELKNDSCGFDDYRAAVDLFDNILKKISSQERRVEAAFASKLLHTVNSIFPIYDSNVKRTLCIEDIGGGDYAYRLEKSRDKYMEICEFYYLPKYTELRQKMVKAYNLHVGNDNISEIKKIDYILWGLGMSSSKQ